MKKPRLFLSVLALFCATIVMSQVTLSLPQTNYERGANVVVSYVNGQLNSNDWIGIAPLGQEITGIPGGYTTTYAYLTIPSAATGTATVPAGNFNSAPDGYYYAVYLLKDGYEAASNKVYFYVGDALPVTTAKVFTNSTSTTTSTTLTFTDDITWRTLVYEVNIDGTAIATADYTLDAGNLIIKKDLTIGIHNIIVKATNWIDSELVIDFSTNVNSLNIQDRVLFNSSTSTLAVDNSSLEFNSIRIYSVKGVVLSQINLNNQVQSIDLSSLNPGVYFVEIINNKQKTKTLKIIL